MTHILASRWARWPRPSGSCIYARFFALSGCGLRLLPCARLIPCLICESDMSVSACCPVRFSVTVSLPWSLRGGLDTGEQTVCASMAGHVGFRIEFL